MRGVTEITRLAKRTRCSPQAGHAALTVGLVSLGSASETATSSTPQRQSQMLTTLIMQERMVSPLIYRRCQCLSYTSFSAPFGAGTISRMFGLRSRRSMLGSPKSVTPVSSRACCSRLQTKNAAAVDAAAFFQVVSNLVSAAPGPALVAVTAAILDSHRGDLVIPTA